VIARDNAGRCQDEPVGVRDGQDVGGVKDKISSDRSDLTDNDGHRIVGRVWLRFLTLKERIQLLDLCQVFGLPERL
jgi:hypothetical protein